MLKKLIQDGYKQFFFDLDGTIWNCYDHLGFSIWCKQMISPFKYDKLNSEIVDDVNSYCVLQPNVEKVLQYLNEQDVEIGICTSSKNMNFEYSIEQPCLQLLNAFDLKKYFNIFHIEYKTADKSKILSKYEKCVLFDDRLNIINDCKKTNNICPIYRFDFDDWKEIL